MSKFAYDKFNRRMFLKGVGGLIACPLFSSLIPFESKAAGVSKKRFVGTSTPNQLPPSLLFPSGYVGRNIPSDLLPFVQQKSADGYPYRESNLSNMISVRGQLSNALDSNFNSLINDISIFRGLDLSGRTDHGRATTLGNLGGCILGKNKGYQPNLTFDEVLANSLAFYPQGRSSVRFPIMRLGEISLGTSSISASDITIGAGLSGANAPLSLNGNLKLVFDEMFAVRGSDAPKIPIVDRILASANSLFSSGKLSAADKVRFQDYLDSVNDLEKSLSTSSGAPLIPKPSMILPDVNANRSNMGERSDGVSLTPSYYQNCADLVVLAMKCGSTKIATVGLDSALQSPTHSVTQNGPIRDWHLLYAHGNDIPNLTTLNKFALDNVFKRIVTGLKVDDGTGETYLDHTLVYFSSECSTGHSGINYSGVVAGNRTGGVNLGKAFEYADWAKGYATTYGAEEVGPGQPLNRMWVGISNSLGLTPTDYLGKYGSSSRTFGYFEDNYPTAFEAWFGNIPRSNQIGNALSGIFSPR